MIYYINGVIIVLLLWLAVGAWRLRHRRVTPGAAAAGMLEEMLTNDRRAAIEIIVDEKTAYRDPEDRDGNLPNLSAGSHTTRSDTRELSAVPPTPVRNEQHRAHVTGPSFRRGAAFGILLWAAVCGSVALMVDLRMPMPSSLTSVAQFNLALGAIGAVLVYRRQQRATRRPLA